MNRRDFFRKAGLVSLGSSLPAAAGLLPAYNEQSEDLRNQKARNIIFMVSDGMSQGTLTLADVYSRQVLGHPSTWLELYRQNKVVRGLMDMASANSVVTDSAAASSSWGSGQRVNNGALNISPEGEALTPIWKKMKKAGKKVGCVTTVPVTHATPAGFLANNKSRNDQESIAQTYLNEGYDLLLGGGLQYFSAENRKDKKDLLNDFRQNRYSVFTRRNELLNWNHQGKVLGLFADDGLPYSVDRHNIKDLDAAVPTLAEMTRSALRALNTHKEGFVLQIEAGKVDWAAHANCVGGLLFDQLAFDEALKEVMQFAENRNDTLVIFTSDHGNANPGLLYGKNTNQHLAGLAQFKHSNDWILHGIDSKFTAEQVRERIAFANGQAPELEQCQQLLQYYKDNHREEDGLYNYRKLPFSEMAQLQKKYTSVGWIGNDHSADFTELAAFGPGSHLIKAHMRNTEMHFLMLQAAEVSAK